MLLRSPAQAPRRSAVDDENVLAPPLRRSRRRPGTEPAKPPSRTPGGEPAVRLQIQLPHFDGITTDRSVFVLPVGDLEVTVLDEARIGHCQRARVGAQCLKPFACSRARAQSRHDEWSARIPAGSASALAIEVRHSSDTTSGADSSAELQAARTTSSAAVP